MKERFDKTKNRIRYEFVYGGYLIDDWNYFDRILRKRKKEFFNLIIRIKRIKNKKGIRCFYYSKAVLQFFKMLGVKEGRKDNIGISDIIKNSSKNIKVTFLRGLADTDFSVSFKNKTIKGYTYPVIKGSFKSKPLIIDIEAILKEFGFILSPHIFSCVVLKYYFK